MGALKQVVLATGNPGKAREMESMLGEAFEALTQADFEVVSPAETGASFLENALLKARHAAALSGLPAIGDDSGLEVDALDGAPGIYSARYAGINANDEQNVARLLRQLRDVPEERRQARFRCVAVYVRSADDPSPIIVEGAWEGSIALAPRGQGGFGYDPVFIDPDSGRTAAELNAAAKNARSHRGQAMQSLKERLAGLPE
jgi:XTP/dITP diphosphohydrolase